LISQRSIVLFPDMPNKAKNRDEAFTVNIEPELARRFRVLADEEGQTLSGMLRKLIRESVKDAEAAKK
jgi:predicted transcriptional regulator